MRFLVPLVLQKIFQLLYPNLVVRYFFAQLEQNRGQSAVLEKTLSEYRESREKLEKQCIELQQTIFANQQEKNNLNEQIKNNEKAINALKNQNLSKMSNSEEQGIIEFRLLYLSFDAYHLFFSFFYFLLALFD